MAEFRSADVESDSDSDFDDQNNTSEESCSSSYDSSDSGKLIFTLLLMDIVI